MCAIVKYSDSEHDYKPFWKIKSILFSCKDNICYMVYVGKHYN